MTARDVAARTDGRRRYHPTDYGQRPWQALLGFALARADTFACALPYRVVRQDFIAARLPVPVLERFRDDIEERYAGLIRWGVLREEPTEFVTLRLSPELRRAIQQVRRLEEWSWEHGRPEDPTLLLGDAPILETESVDGRVSLYATADEMASLAASGVRLVEPLGVHAEPWPTP